MKRKVTFSFFIAITALTVTFNACKPEDPSTETTTTERSAKYKVDGVETTADKPYNGIYNDNGTINNTAKLKGKDGSIIEFQFEGKTPATYTLKAYPDAVYTNKSGQKYNASNGELKVTQYTTDGTTYKFSGTFSFTAKSIADPKDSVVITEGVITNCSNEF